MFGKIVSLGLILTWVFQSPESQLDQGIRLIKERRFTEAITLFNEIKQGSPKDARPYFYAGMALADSGRLTASALELSEAVRLDPHHPEYRVLQANVYARLKQGPLVDDTLEPLQKDGATETLGASWMWLLVDAYFRVERLDDTLKTLDLMEKRFPDDPRL